MTGNARDRATRKAPRRSRRRAATDAEFDVRLTARAKTIGRKPARAAKRAPGGAAVVRDLAPGSSPSWLPHDEFVTSTGTRVVHLQQYFQGLRVYRSARVVKSPRRRGAVTSAGAEASIPRSTPTLPTLMPAPALQAAVAFLQRRRAFPRSFHPRVLQEQRFNLPGMPTVLTCLRGLAEPVRAHLEVFPTARRQARLAWVLEIAPGNRSRYEVVVSADDRRPVVLFSTQTTSCLDFDASWITFPRDAEVPDRFPIPVLAAPLGSPTPGPSNWLDAAGTARGPNVTCHDGTTQAAQALGGLKVQNAFVWCNFLRDFFAAFGFDHSLGAFDSGQDPLQVRLFKSKSDLGGLFDNRVDGFSPTMELFAARSAAGLHAALDPSVLVHEYTHGVSNRLLGGAAQSSPFVGREAQGLNEGYSDYFALTVLTFLDRTSGNRELRRIGSAFKPTGIRDYSGFKQVFSSSLTDKYELAMVWCAGLLDARALLAAQPGVSAGDADCFLWQALLDSLRVMAPVCPQANCLSLAHAKDALLTASDAIEQGVPAFVGATAAIDAALTARNIP